jgi:hypothetical protein
VYDWFELILLLFKLIIKDPSLGQYGTSPRSLGACDIFTFASRVARVSTL